MGLILELHINCTHVEELETTKGTIVQICFDGKAFGEYFQGEVMPGGVDTQKYDVTGQGGLSARYMLKGKDYTGQNCRMFIENNGVNGAEYTTPVIYTDSEALDWLNTAALRGKVVVRQDDVQILIEKVEQ